jgi:dUTP pyrophosphatase
MADSLVSSAVVGPRDTNLPMMDILMQRLHPRAVLPTSMHVGDAGCDLVAVAPTTLTANGGRALIPLGFAIAIPEGYAGLVLPRSGLAFKHGVTCINAPGLIDAGFRGELQVALVNHDPLNDYTVEPGDRIAQLVIHAVPPVSFVEVADLPESTRGSGGFGSTGR